MKSDAGSSGENQEPPVRVATTTEIDALPLTTQAVLVERLDDEKARALARLTELHTLYQDGNPILTDEGLAALASLNCLRVLDLEWCATITDKGLATLHRLNKLEWLDLGLCSGLTDVGVSELRSALPGCKIELSG